MERKRTIIWDDPRKSSRDAASISGLDYLTSILNGRISPPPAAHLLGYRLVEVSSGYAAFELDPQEYLYNPFATVHGGILSTLLDTAMTASVLTTLEKGLACSTVEFKMNFIRPVTSDTGTLRCEANPVHMGKRISTAEGKVRDRNGSLYAHGVSTLLVFKVKGPA
jgi:uncharacterized protein (TIGR00369 family)